MIVAGIDVGSLSTDVVLWENEHILASVVIPTGKNGQQAGYQALESALEQAKIVREKIAFIVATGLGRVNQPFAFKWVTDITCHSRGAQFLFPNTRTVIDIGGMDTKIIRLDREGRIRDFLMNEKCAAGNGRFLEVMAKTLEVDLSAMTGIARKAKKTAPVNNTCIVYAESDVLGYIARGVAVGEIIRGINQAIAYKVGGMALQVKVEEAVTITGGVAKNQGVVESISRYLGVKVQVPFEPQTVGALGAALVAADLARGELPLGVLN